MIWAKLAIFLLVPLISSAQQNSFSNDEVLFKEVFGTFVSFSTITAKRKPPVNVSGLKKKYIFSFNKVNWWKARELCESQGQELASVQSDAELKDFLADYNAANMTTERMWIGGNDLAKEGTFVWATRPPITFSFTAWFKNEPSNRDGKEHCLDIWPKHNGLWNDSPCELEFEYACQKFESK